MGFLETAGFVAVVAVIMVHKILSSIRNKTAGWSAIKHMDIVESPILSSRKLAIIRLSIAAFQLCGIANRVFFGRITRFCNEDETKCVPYGGAYLLTTFTVWSWNLQGLYFLVTGICGFFPHLLAKRRGLVFSLWVLFEVSFAVALLVFLVVWTVLIPGMEYKIRNNIKAEAALKLWRGREQNRRGLKVMMSFWALCFHNLNVVFMALEMGLNSLPFRAPHSYFACLYGLSYVFFSWIFHHYTGVWYYFFLDYARPYAVVSYAALLVVLLAFFALGQYIANVTKPRVLLWLGAVEPQMALRSRDRSRDRSAARQGGGGGGGGGGGAEGARSERGGGGAGSSPRGRRGSTRSASKGRRRSSSGGREAKVGESESVGQHVLGWHESGGWFDATVVAARGGVYEVQWHDGDASDTVKRSGEVMLVDGAGAGPFSVGESVMALYGDGDDGWHEATVVQRRGRKFEVEWRDGDTADTVKSESELRRKSLLRE